MQSSRSVLYALSLVTLVLAVAASAAWMHGRAVPESMSALLSSMVLGLFALAQPHPATDPISPASVVAPAAGDVATPRVSSQEATLPTRRIALDPNPAPGGQFIAPVAPAPQPSPSA